jgi:hypothetical protein
MLSTHRRFRFWKKGLVNNKKEDMPKKIINALTITPSIQLKTGETIVLSKMLPSPNVANGTVTGEPAPENGTLFLVNARVWGATDRTDFITWDDDRAERDPITNYVVKQHGFMTRDGSRHEFDADMFS